MFVREKGGSPTTTIFPRDNHIGVVILRRPCSRCPCFRFNPDRIALIVFFHLPLLLLDSSSSAKNPLPEQRKLSATIHAAFNELQPIHMPLERTIAPRQGQACKYRRFVLLHAFGKRLQLWQMARFCLAEPSIQLVSSLLSDHLHERLCQAVSRLCTGTGLPDQCQLG